MRADLLLIRRGLAPSRTAAQRLIEAGRVRFERAGHGARAWQTLAKASLDLPADTLLELLPDAEDRYVSRGGRKLAGALAHTALDVSGWTCLDVGQSTGGFSDCLLQAGAARVVGVEVGHGQLHPRLRGHTRVVCLEGLNARELSREMLGPHCPAQGFDLIVADLSFISLTLILPRLPPLLAPTGHLLLLVKPQFELGPQALGKGGIVRDDRLYATVQAKLYQACLACGIAPVDWFASAIPGGDGNREFFLHARQRRPPRG